MRLIELLKREGLTISSSESRRLVAMGAVRLNGQLHTDMQAEVEVKPGDVLECGRKRVEIKGGFTPPTRPAQIKPAYFE